MDFAFLKGKIEGSYFPKEMLSTSSTGDGRLASAESESTVIEHIMKVFSDVPEVEVLEAPPRHWYDMSIQYKDKFYPINVKITTGKSADNISSKKGMFYALTGILPDNVKGLDRWAVYNTELLKNLQISNDDKDYYFIVYFKESGEFLFSSLKRLQVLVPNGNNLPFQCKWNDNILPSSRTPEEQNLYILNTFIDSFQKKVSGLDILLEWREKHG